MTRDDVIKKINTIQDIELREFVMLTYDLGRRHEREACANRANVALLGTLQTTADRVLKAIRGGQE
jgi:hypothetical protein